MMQLRAGLTLLLALAACTPAGVFVCALDGDCSGGTCEANGFCSFADTACPSGRRYGAHSGGGLGGVCVGDEPDAAPMIDAAADAGPMPDGGVLPGACGSTDLLKDDFADGVRGIQWGHSFTNGTATTAETGGHLVITLATTGNLYAGYATDLAYDLRGHAISVELVTAPNGATTAQGVMSLRHPVNQGAVAIELSQGTLSFQRTTTAGVKSSVGTLAFDAVQHRFWRVREAGGMVFYETSPDGVTYTTRGQGAAPFDLHYVRLDLVGGTYEPVASPGQVVFDNVNGTAPASAFCAPETLIDRFGDTDPGEAWARTTTANCVISEAGGVVTLTPSATTGSLCQLGTSTAYDVRGKAVLVRVPQMVNTATDTLVYFRLADYNAGPSHYVGFFQRSGELLAQSRTGGTETDVTVPYSATNHRWWRIREAGGMVLWETSPDAVTWTMQRMSAAPIAMSQIVVDLSVENGSGAASPGAVQFDDFNAPP